MNQKLISKNSLLVSLIIIILVLIVMLYGFNAKSKTVFTENKKLLLNIDALTDKIAVLSSKLNEIDEELKRQALNLQETKNSLTRERLKNTQLSQDIENLKPKVIEIDSRQ